MMKPPHISCCECINTTKHILEYPVNDNEREYSAYCSACGVEKLTYLLKRDIDVEVHEMMPYPENRG